MREQWRPVRQYEEHYEVSNLGRVRRKLGCRGATAGRILRLKAPTHSCDYLRVQLCKRDVKRTHMVHALVAEAFIGRRPRRCQVNHRNLDKLDNRAANLEWLTNRRNSLHALRTRRRSGASLPRMSNGNARLSERQVAEIKRQRGRIGQRVLAALCGVSKTAIQKIHQGRAWPEDLRVREFPEARRG